MRSLERHRDVGAYALGVLDEAESFRFEDHLTQCPSCAVQVTEFRPTARQLMLYRNATPRIVSPFAQPGPRLLDRLLEQMTARHRSRRRRLLYGLAASVVLAAAGASLAARAGHAEPAVRVTAATDARSGVWAQVMAENEGWGSQIELRIRDGAGPRSCRLVAVGLDGSEQIVTSWAVPRHDTATSTVQGASALHPSEVARYEVRGADGTRLVTLAPR